MRNKVIYVVVSMLMVLGLLLGGFGCAKEVAPTTPTTPTTPAAPTAPEVTKWILQIHLPPAEPFGPYEPYVFFAMYAYYWRDWIEEATDGRMEVELVQPDAAFPSTEVLEAIGSRVTEGWFGCCAWFAGAMPEMKVAGGMPMSWSSIGEMYDAWFNYGLYEKCEPLFERRNIKFIPASSFEYTNIFTTWDIPGPDALKGYKIRAPGQWGDYAGVIGATPVSLPYSDIYMGMKLGTIDGVFTGAQSLDTIKLYEVVTDFCSNQNGTLHGLLMNMDAFNELPIDIQGLIMGESVHHFNSISLELLEQQAYTLGMHKEAHGLELWKWSEEDMAKVRKDCVAQLWPKYASETALSAELVEIIKQQLRDHGKL